MFDTASPAVFGPHQEFLASARLDNLSSMHASIAAMINCGTDVIQMIVAFDHEGAGERLSQRPLVRCSLMSWPASLPAWAPRLISGIDLSASRSACRRTPVTPFIRTIPAGTITLQPLLNAGPLLKMNANQRYATDGRGAALWRRICRKLAIPTQEFVSNNAMPCGSTIGPLTATRLGIATIDVGIPTLSMHSARELLGTDSPLALTRAMEAFLAAESLRTPLGLSPVALTIGIVGLPNAGKSTLFNALTGMGWWLPAIRCTIDPNIGVVGVPDAVGHPPRNSSIPPVPYLRL